MCKLKSFGLQALHLFVLKIWFSGKSMQLPTNRYMTHAGAVSCYSPIYIRLWTELPQLRNHDVRFESNSSPPARLRKEAEKVRLQNTRLMRYIQTGLFWTDTCELWETSTRAFQYNPDNLSLILIPRYLQVSCINSSEISCFLQKFFTETGWWSARRGNCPPIPKVALKFAGKSSFSCISQRNISVQINETANGTYCISLWSNLIKARWFTNRPWLSNVYTGVGRFYPGWRQL